MNLRTLRNGSLAPAITLEGTPGNTKIHTWTKHPSNPGGLGSKRIEAFAAPQRINGQ
jgi:hypothetical protein